jgi:spore maturation protein A
MEVWKKSGVTRKVSRLVKPLSKRLFKTDNDEILDAVCMNLSVNMLGVSGAGTPYGITACKLLDKTENAEYSSALFFVLNATSLQIIPTSVVGIRTALGSVAPADIILPTFLSSTLSTLLGFFLVKALIPQKNRKQIRGFTLKKVKSKGAGI